MRYPVVEADLGRLLQCEVGKFIRLLPTLLPEAYQFEFVCYRPREGVGSRIQRMGIELCFAGAHQEQQSGQAFWGRMCQLMRSHPEQMELFSKNLALHSNEDEGKLFRRGPNSLEADGQLDMGVVQPGQVVGLSSNVVRSSGETGWIPMLDFQCPARPEFDQVLVSLLASATGWHGLLLRSGAGYHYYGVTLLDLADWVEFMARALLFQPFVDSRFVGHRLIERRATLRITTCELKPYTPRIVAVVPPRCSHRT